MKNYVSDGKIVTVIAPANLVSGQPFRVASLFLVAIHAASSGQPVAASRQGVFTLPKLAANNMTLGLKVNFNATTGELQLATSDLDNVATVVEAAGAATTSVKVVLTPV